MSVLHSIGSVVGVEHIIDGKSNGDAWSLIQTQNRFVAAIADGCGDPRTVRSEYGAIFGSTIVAKTAFDLSMRIAVGREDEVFKSRSFWARIEDDTLAHLRTNALLFEGGLNSIIDKYFLFTILGVIITPITSVFFGIGDGNIFVNEDHLPFGPYNNAPPYLSHRLKSVSSGHDPAILQFAIHRVIPTKELRTFLLGTDGTNYIIENEKNPLPGRTDLVGPISQFWKNDKIFGNPAGADLRLSLMSGEKQRVDWENKRIEKFPGLLSDDTTILTGRLV